MVSPLLLVLTDAFILHHWEVDERARQYPHLPNRELFADGLACRIERFAAQKIGMARFNHAASSEGKAKSKNRLFRWLSGTSLLS
ncbi:hypothetical protein [Methylobacter sp. BlB1]|uniref:hypothetical protein n=1 Tax=Methylobacter sp. BlB1 TaxID=2785914 RepID=UPI001893BD90|nr:hypothetical protein [Methylobacter sp. BlB1]MBF6649910.1 hypothetical protein [Methylobacter sp. BlB1]